MDGEKRTTQKGEEEDRVKEGGIEEEVRWLRDREGYDANTDREKRKS